MQLPGAAAVVTTYLPSSWFTLIILKRAVHNTQLAMQFSRFAPEPWSMHTPRYQYSTTVHHATLSQPIRVDLQTMNGEILFVLLSWSSDINTGGFCGHCIEWAWACAIQSKLVHSQQGEEGITDELLPYVPRSCPGTCQASIYRRRSCAGNIVDRLNCHGARTGSKWSCHRDTGPPAQLGTWLRRHKAMIEMISDFKKPDTYSCLHDFAWLYCR